MRYLTDRKKAMGRGPAHSGTERHWFMSVTAVALAFMVPVWLYIFGTTLGQGRDVVLETFARPFPAILTGLVLFVGMRHFAMGARNMFEDYSGGATRKSLIMAANALSYAVTATGLFALAKIAL